MQPGTIIVFAGGQALDDDTAQRVAAIEADLVIAADSGADRAIESGRWPDVVVGDLDSIDPATLTRLRGADEVEIDDHPSAKDETDLELALARAHALGPSRIVVTALDGGRADHRLANLLLLGDPRLAGVQLDAELAGATAGVVHAGDAPRSLDARPGDLVTLLPLGGAAEGVVTSGLEYPLRGERLAPGSSRGVSNVCITVHPTVEVSDGVLLTLVVRPPR